MTLAAKGPPRRGSADGPIDAVCLLSSSAADLHANSPPRPNTQIKFQNPAEAEFDAEIALALTASGWRAAAGLLTHAALLIEAGDYLSAERNRQRAREQFVEANRLRLVEKPPLAPRLEVRVHVLNGRSAYGRSRAFRLAESDIDELIAVAMRIEGRRA
jgi:hypothetical protein